MLLTLTFTPDDTGAAIRWEAEVLGVRTSRFTFPFVGDDLALVLRALEALQHPTYPLFNDPDEAELFTFSMRNRSG